MRKVFGDMTAMMLVGGAVVMGAIAFGLPLLIKGLALLFAAMDGIGG